MEPPETVFGVPHGFSSKENMGSPATNTTVRTLRMAAYNAEENHCGLRSTPQACHLDFMKESKNEQVILTVAQNPQRSGGSFHGARIHGSSRATERLFAFSSGKGRKV